MPTTRPSASSSGAAAQPLQTRVEARIRPAQRKPFRWMAASRAATRAVSRLAAASSGAGAVSEAGEAEGHPLADGGPLGRELHGRGVGEVALEQGKAGRLVHGDQAGVEPRSCPDATTRTCEEPATASRLVRT